MATQNKINNLNYFHRVFLGWLACEIAAGRVSRTRRIKDMAPIDLEDNRELFERFLEERNEKLHWEQLQQEHGPIKILTYFNG